jgi:hypothetical protein
MSDLTQRWGSTIHTGANKGDRVFAEVGKFLKGYGGKKKDQETYWLPTGTKDVWWAVRVFGINGNSSFGWGIAYGHDFSSKKKDKKEWAADLSHQMKRVPGPKYDSWSNSYPYELESGYGSDAVLIRSALREYLQEFGKWLDRAQRVVEAVTAEYYGAGGGPPPEALQCAVRGVVECATSFGGKVDPAAVRKSLQTAFTAGW